MQNHESVDDWLQAQPGHIRELSVALRQFISEVAPKLTESMKWGNACWSDDGLPLVFIHAADAHVQLGFFAGSLLDDPDGLLRGNGKYVRHIRVESVDDIDEAEFEKMIVRAVEGEPYR
jgi:hypothetical protein